MKNLPMNSSRPECVNCPVLSTSLFRNLSGDQAARLSCVFRPAHYHRNQILYFEGGQAKHLFSLRTGLVKLVKSLENGKDRIVRALFPGEIFGFESLAESSYPLTAVVLKDSEICSVSRDAFFDFLRSNTDIALAMIAFLVGEVARVRTQITDMSFKDARTRLATLLLSLVVPGEANSNGSALLTLPFSSQEIGEILEFSSETVSRTWTALQKDRLIEKRGRQIVIPDLGKLEAATRR
jgi:CRP-like cAMP-binding protein